jgi:hypothetical protein
VGRCVGGRGHGRSVAITPRATCGGGRTGSRAARGT